MEDIYDCIVVGAGIVGSCSALFSQRDGSRTLLLDQFAIPNSRGSSGGHSRITRRCYPENDALAHMMEEGYDLWRWMERESGMQLFKNCGLLLVEAGDAPSLRHAYKIMKAANYTCDWLTPQQLAKGYPQLSYPGYNGVFDPTGGLLRPEKCLAASQAIFRKLGGECLETTEVLTITTGDIVTLATNKGMLRCRRLVICPGSWARPLLSKINIEIPCEALGVAVTYWPVKDSSHNSDTFPCLIDMSQADKIGMYAIPEFEYPGLMKLVLPMEANVPRQPERRDEVPIGDHPFAREYVRTHLPLLVPVPAIIERCMYTQSVDSQFILGAHPHHPNVVFACGMSGHGFKTAAVIGKTMAEMSRGLPPRYDLGTMLLKRFKGAKL